MINNEEFAKRLQKVIDYYNESASSFAEKIGVQRSSISHILSGRNKPSLDFVLKVLSSFPEVELYWLLNGKGQFPSEEKLEVKIPIEKNSKEEKKPPVVSNILQTEKKGDSEKSIERIVIFYSDGSFKNFEEL
ncbi:helix-turn-helix domain-containing protein [Xanthomarina sp. F2636L]|uniref:helix-turn-helix domain-containing protein n=1 Tax=Xanthomarina sp. F2636L TaxID=2996018 RepID=UPI00225DFB8A|nr:helix-turn-helix transcriptional regulator [Xanthomarina sp. F2636L]MCX7549488.1 helix-turn-helix transcriptional regulator [Xanthomarina sp. F2636L]